jgi:hypothetical protein
MEEVGHYPIQSYFGFNRKELQLILENIHTPNRLYTSSNVHIWIVQYYKQVKVRFD